MSVVPLAPVISTRLRGGGSPLLRPRSPRGAAGSSRPAAPRCGAAAGSSRGSASSGPEWKTSDAGLGDAPAGDADTDRLVRRHRGVQLEARPVEPLQLGRRLQRDGFGQVMGLEVAAARRPAARPGSRPAPPSRPRAGARRARRTGRPGSGREAAAGSTRGRASSAIASAAIAAGVAPLAAQRRRDRRQDPLARPRHRRFPACRTAP